MRDESRAATTWHIAHLSNNSPQARVYPKLKTFTQAEDENDQGKNAS